MATNVWLEFPQIRIDYFRQQPEYKPPLACFLSHVHSDHLTGLETFRAPFVYCSAATREVSEILAHVRTRSSIKIVWRLETDHPYRYFCV
jgi:phosphoribosyl 1,2-cyclic phosphodiesterase